MEVGEQYDTTNYGTLEIIEYFSSTNVTIRFLATGYIRKNTESRNIRQGRVKDPFHPNVQGVGFMGEGKYVSSINSIDTKEYTVWGAMFGRCYSDQVHEKQPSYIGCTVAPEWHNFQVFATWFADNYIEGCELDKDSVVLGNKVYSESTCVFIPSELNTTIANSKVAIFVSPEGKKVVVSNLSAFSRENNLSKTTFNSVSLGDRKHHKGWRKYTGPSSLVPFKAKPRPLFLSPEGEILGPEEGEMQKDFAAKHGLTSAGLSTLTSGKQKTHKGWKKAPPQTE